jgi:DNA-binding NarL/FixJ family response regulator
LGKLVDNRTPWRPDELLVLGLVSLGKTDKEIAHQVGVSQAAVKKRIARLRRLLGATNRAELIRVAMEQGLIAALMLGLDLSPLM